MSSWCSATSTDSGLGGGVIEVAVVLGADHRPVYWHVPPGVTGGSIPDSRDLWEVLWNERTRLCGVAHSHPGAGPPGPSFEDLTTFAACDAALGRRLEWWIATADQVGCFTWRGPGSYDYVGREPIAAAEVAGWLDPLRARSGLIAPRGGRGR